MRRFRNAVLGLFTVLLLSSCAAVSQVGDLAAKPLEYVGLIESSKEEAEAAAQAAKNQKDALQRAAIRKVELSLSAGANLNANEDGVGLALVVRVYGLKDATAFQQLPLESFSSPEREAEALGADVVTTRELVITPGQKLQSQQQIDPEVNAIGVVALFREPAVHRWRLVFELKQAAREGIVLGANACALSATAGLSGADPEGLSWRLLPARCP